MEVLDIKLRWEDAIIYASNKGMFIPNKEEAKKLNTSLEVWTSTTCKYDIHKAYSSKVETVNKNKLLSVVLINESECNKGISYCLGDVSGLNR